MQQQLLILRGLPGSGKSTFASMLERNCSFVHFEADMYFDLYCDGNFDPKKLPAAHNWCHLLVEEALALGRSVVVSNTFTQEWEFKHYIAVAKSLRVPYTVMTVENYHGNKSVHNVPEETMQKMRNRFQINL